MQHMNELEMKVAKSYLRDGRNLVGYFFLCMDLHSCFSELLIYASDNFFLEKIVVI